MILPILLAAFTEPPKPEIVNREQWGAKLHRPGAKVHQITRLTIHHTGVAQNAARSLEDKLRGLQAFSQREDKLADGRTKPAWPDIPYHYYISVDGRIGEGRRYRYVGDTNTTYDPTGHLLIVVEGNFETELPKPEQIASLQKLVTWALWNWRLDASTIMGHGDFASTDCPGKNLVPFVRALHDRKPMPEIKETQKEPASHQYAKK